MGRLCPANKPTNSPHKCPRTPLLPAALQAVDQALALVRVHRAYDAHAVLSVLDALLQQQVRCFVLIGAKQMRQPSLLCCTPGCHSNCHAGPACSTAPVLWPP